MCAIGKQDRLSGLRFRVSRQNGVVQRHVECIVVQSDDVPVSRITKEVEILEWVSNSLSSALLSASRSRQLTFLCSRSRQRSLRGSWLFLWSVLVEHIEEETTNLVRVATEILEILCFLQVCVCAASAPT